MHGGLEPSNLHGTLSHCHKALRQVKYQLRNTLPDSWAPPSSWGSRRPGLHLFHIPPPLPLPPQSLIPGKDVKATQFEANFGFFKKRISVGFTKGNGEWLQGHPPPLAPPLAPARRVLPRPLLGTWCRLGCKLAGSPLPASMD